MATATLIGGNRLAVEREYEEQKADLIGSLLLMADLDEASDVLDKLYQERAEVYREFKRRSKIEAARRQRRA